MNQCMLRSGVDISHSKKGGPKPARKGRCGFSAVSPTLVPTPTPTPTPTHRQEHLSHTDTYPNPYLHPPTPTPTHAYSNTAILAHLDTYTHTNTISPMAHLKDAHLHPPQRSFRIPPNPSSTAFDRSPSA
jgi:hypothetical protein